MQEKSKNTSLKNKYLNTGERKKYFSIAMLFNLIQDMPTLYPKEIKAFIT
jgi:uncharacterized membrane protein